jgi:hypothetical protein
MSNPPPQPAIKIRSAFANIERNGIIAQPSYRGEEKRRNTEGSGITAVMDGFVGMCTLCRGIGRVDTAPRSA